MTKFSVLIPTYNSKKYIRAAIDSVLSQTYTNYELIVVDDGSTDGTGEILKEYFGKIKYIYKRNGGVSSARNEGICAAHGDYIAFLDSDDCWMSKKLEMTFEAIKTDPLAGLFYSDMYCVDERGRIKKISRGSTYRDCRELLLTNNIQCSTVVVRRDCFDVCGTFCCDYESPAGVEDWDMWLKIAEQYTLHYIEAPTAYYRVHENSTFNRNIEKVNRDILRALTIAFERNVYSKRFISKVYAHHCKCNGRRFLKNMDLRAARDSLICSIKKNPFSINAYLLLILCFGGKNLCRCFLSLKSRYDALA